MARFWEKLFGINRVSRKEAANREQRRRSLRRVMQLETLQKREVFATLVDAMTLTFQDKDGDQVQVQFAKPILTQSNVNSMFKFDVQEVNGSNAFAQQLRQVNLSANPSAAGVGMEISVTQKGAGGDGLVHVGEVMASGMDAGRITIDGDLGRIVAGDADLSTRGLNRLRVHSLGVKGVSTGASDLVSKINGGVSSITVARDITNAQLSVHGNAVQITVGGSIRGSLFANTGRIYVNGSVEGVAVDGSLLGGSGENSGRIEVTGKIDKFDILGSIQGGNGAGSGAVAAAAGFGTIYVEDNLKGGNGIHSGSIATLGDIDNLYIRGSVIGAGMRSGDVIAWGSIDSLRVDGPILGGSGAESGLIDVQHTIADANLGSLGGGAGYRSGRIKAHDLGQVRMIQIKGGSGIGSGTLEATNSIAFLEVGKITGGSGAESGSVRTVNGDILDLLIAGNLQGGQGVDSGSVRSGGAIVNAHVDLHIIGGTGERSGRMSAKSSIGNLDIDGNIVGNIDGKGRSNGTVYSGGDIGSLIVSSLLGGAGEGAGTIHAAHDIQHLQVTGDVVGSKGFGSGRISSGGNLVDVQIDGSLIGGTNHYSGEIAAMKELISLKIDKDLKGGDLDSEPGAGNGLTQAGYVRAQTIVNMEVGGSIIAGVNHTKKPFSNNGAVRAYDNIVSLVVHGNLEGSLDNPVYIAARGLPVNSRIKDLAIGSIRVDGSTTNAQILAGVDFANRMINADASIGTIFIGHDFSLTDIVAGAVAGKDNQFGTFDDRKAFGADVLDVGGRFATIDEVYIGGEIKVPRNIIDPSWGIAAEEIGSVKLGSASVPMTAGRGNDHISIGDPAFGVTLHEIGVKKGSRFDTRVVTKS